MKIERDIEEMKRRNTEIYVEIDRQEERAKKHVPKYLWHTSSGPT